jgi:hypothetical protein
LKFKGVFQNGWKFRGFCEVSPKNNDKLTILSLYVDYILLIGNCPNMIKNTKAFLASKFEMKDMGAANYVLGIKISRNRKSKLLYLDQEKYLEKILKKFNMSNCKPLSTPISNGQHLSKTMCPQNETEIKKNGINPICSSRGESHVCHDKYKT